MATNGAVVKPDPDATPQIKIEQDGVSPSPYMEEDDIYEDAGDLDFTNAAQPLWLARLPAAMWNAWADMADDEEIELGTVRIEGDFSAPTRVSLWPTSPESKYRYIYIYIYIYIHMSYQREKLTAVVFTGQSTTQGLATVQKRAQRMAFATSKSRCRQPQSFEQHVRFLGEGLAWIPATAVWAGT